MAVEDSVLGSALKCLLDELGCVVTERDNIAIITYRSRRIILEKRGNYWHDSEKNLWFYSRAQIANYMARPTLGAI